MSVPDSAGESTQLLLCLDRARAGDPAARSELLALAGRRLELLARKMLRGFPSVHRWEQTDDVLQNASLRLHRALEATLPEDTQGFFRLAAVQMRRELLDLARHYSGPQGHGAHHASHGGPTAPPPEPGDDTHEPNRLAAWTEFHEAVAELPDEEREVTHLLWYQGLTQREAADLLGTTERVVGSRWRSARLRLHRQLQGRLPDL